MRYFSTFFLCLAALSASAQKRITPTEYIDMYKHLAVADMRAYGIPASVKMAQALLESDAGNSRLATEANNHFGIKCKSTWRGETLSHDDDAPGECFRKYPTAEESFRDHAEFLSGSARYERLFALDPMDYRAWAQGLKDCGYATSPSYPERLVGIIERHELYRLDTGEGMGDVVVVETAPEVEIARPVRPPVEKVAATVERGRQQDGTVVKPAVVPARKPRIDVDNYTVSTRTVADYPVFHNNGSEFIMARKGETYEIIGAIARIAPERLRKLNDAGVNDQPVEGEQVYLFPKASRANNGRLMHTVAAGETLRDVSQIYGIKLIALARLNSMNATTPLNEGQQIRLM